MAAQPLGDVIEGQSREGKINQSLTECFKALNNTYNGINLRPMKGICSKVFKMGQNT